MKLGLWRGIMDSADHTVGPAPHRPLAHPFPLLLQ